MEVNKHVMQLLYDRYMDNVFAHIGSEKLVDLDTGELVGPNEAFMRRVEEKLDVREADADDFRRSCAAFVGRLHAHNKPITWDNHLEVAKALIAMRREDQTDLLKINTLMGRTILDLSEDEATLLKELLISIDYDSMGFDGDEHNIFIDISTRLPKFGTESSCEETGCDDIDQYLEDKMENDELQAEMYLDYDLNDDPHFLEDLS